MWCPPFQQAKATEASSEVQVDQALVRRFLSLFFRTAVFIGFPHAVVHPLKMRLGLIVACSQTAGCSSKVQCALLQVYYDYSPVCKAAAPQWEQAARDLSSWARLGRIEWNQQHLLRFLRASMGFGIQPDDLPAVFGFPSACRSVSCGVRCGPLLQQLLKPRLMKMHNL